MYNERDGERYMYTHIQLYRARDTALFHIQLGSDGALASWSRAGTCVWLSLFVVCGLWFVACSGGTACLTPLV